ncbi:MAG: energy-coupling factor ABC transporter substrate-binding protein [Chloroflexaceae bacterium]|nr:energy-coupling factor ABC transporter substrate-binding protein [Chloroflexaceae bacterium]
MQAPKHTAHTTQTLSRATTWLLLGVVVVLAIVPLFLYPESEFGGADGSAEEVIAKINPEVEPWFAPLWEPPGGETESLLFALQAAIGAGIIGYYFGRKQGENLGRKHPSAPDHE